MRVIKAIVQRLSHLHVDFGRQTVGVLKNNLVDLSPEILSTVPFDKTEDDSRQFVKRLKDKGLLRGEFTVIKENNLDLPLVPAIDNHTAWQQTMHQDVQDTFGPGNSKHLFLQLVHHLDTGADFRPARVHSAPGQYPPILNRLQELGMLSWSVVELENPEYTMLADSLITPPFAVVKDRERDRLISWPRIQNFIMPDAPCTELPNQGHFHKIEDKEKSSLSVFLLDFENMFHNIRMTPHLVPLFPFRLALYGHLTITIQLSLERYFASKPSPDTLSRTLQRALPMGFKWAVFIAHNFVRSCYREAFSIFLPTSDIFSKPQPSPKLLELQHYTGKITPSQRLALVIHIIDDLNFVFV